MPAPANVKFGDARQRRRGSKCPPCYNGNRQGRADQGAGVRERQGRLIAVPGVPEGDVDSGGDRAKGEGVGDRDHDAVLERGTGVDQQRAGASG